MLVLIYGTYDLADSRLATVTLQGPILDTPIPEKQTHSQRFAVKVRTNYMLQHPRTQPCARLTGCTAPHAHSFAGPHLAHPLLRSLQLSVKRQTICA